MAGNRGGDESVQGVPKKKNQEAEDARRKMIGGAGDRGKGRQNRYRARVSLPQSPGHPVSRSGLSVAAPRWHRGGEMALSNRGESGRPLDTGPGRFFDVEVKLPSRS
jgi:hypothetical protein